MLVRLRESYVVEGGPITLDVAIGEGQRGFIEVLLNGTVIKDGTGITALPLGDGASLRGKKLRVTATVTDTNPDTNRTCVTYTLSRGTERQSFKSEHEVGSAGDTVDYDAIFLLV